VVVGVGNEDECDWMIGYILKIDKNVDNRISVSAIVRVMLVIRRINFWSGCFGYMMGYGWIMDIIKSIIDAVRWLSFNLIKYWQ